MTLEGCLQYHRRFNLDGAMFYIHSAFKQDLPAVWSDLERGAFVVAGITEEFLVDEAGDLARQIDCEVIE